MWTNETETYDTQSEADLDGVLAWIIYLSPALLLPVIAVDAFLIVTLVMKGPLPKVIRISLVNILVSCIVMACGRCLNFINFRIYALRTSNYLHRTADFVLVVGVYGRFIFNGYYTILVFIYLRYVAYIDLYTSESTSSLSLYL